MNTRFRSFRNVGAVLLAMVCASAAAPTMRMGTNFWVIGWGADKARINGQWNPVFLNEIRIYRCLRFMDWQGTNSSTVVTWAQRGARDSITYEMMVDLCNINRSDAWFCVPHKADDDFIRQLATLLRDSLDPGLKCYIEYSNETWNTAAPFIAQTAYCSDLAMASGILPKTAEFAEPMGGQWVKKAMYGHAYQMVRVSKIFAEVFGDAMPRRVVTMVASQYSWLDLCKAVLNALLSPAVNPDKVTIGALAVAPYFGANSGGGDIAGAFTAARGINLKPHADLVAWYNQQSGAKAQLLCYEGGQHYTSGADVFARNQQAYDVYRAYLDKVAPYVDLFCHYTHCGKWSGGGAWGAIDHTGQPVVEAPKYRALVDWVAEHPSVAVADRPAVTAHTARLAEGHGCFDVAGRRVEPALRQGVVVGRLGSSSWRVTATHDRRR